MDHQLSFDQELAELKEIVLKMGYIVQDMIQRSVESLKKQDIRMAEQVITKGDEVDKLELEIDEKCISLIALRQPMASDLRFITTGMRIATDLERIGDLAEDIAERTLELVDKPHLKPLIDIPKMADLAKEILSMALDSFINCDSSKAREIWPKEEQVDKLRDQVQDELIEIMSKDPGAVKRALPLLLVSRHLERICDHATNIGEDVVFMVEGKVIKHSGGEV